MVSPLFTAVESLVGTEVIRIGCLTGPVAGLRGVARVDEAVAVGIAEKKANA